MLASYPAPGDSVDFRGDVYVDLRSYRTVLAARRGRLICWMKCGGDMVAVVQTAFGQALVRWSMIVGVQSPAGLRTNAAPG